VAAAYAELGRGGLVTGATGNVSAAGDGIVAITPTGGRPGLTADEVAVVRLVDGAHLGGGATSSELPTHLGLLRAGALAVVHSHAPHATTFGLIADRLPVILAEQVIDLGGGTRVVPYQGTGTQEMASALAERQAAGERGAIVRNHGPVTWGATLERALAATYALEEAARAWLLARAAGAEPMRLPDAEIERLRAR